VASVPEAALHQGVTRTANFSLLLWSAASAIEQQTKVCCPWGQQTSVCCCGQPQLQSSNKLKFVDRVDSKIQLDDVVNTKSNQETK
jgi:hypothetical protein